MVLNTQPTYGSTGVRRKINFGQKDLVLISFILIYFGIAVYVSYDAFNFGEPEKEKSEPKPKARPPRAKKPAKTLSKKPTKKPIKKPAKEPAKKPVKKPK